MEDNIRVKRMAFKEKEKLSPNPAATEAIKRAKAMDTLE
jgi:hypothetical protein